MVQTLHHSLCRGPEFRLRDVTDVGAAGGETSRVGYTLNQLKRQRVVRVGQERHVEEPDNITTETNAEDLFLVPKMASAD